MTTTPSGMEFWADRPVLVTGATGLAGSWLVRALVENGARVVTLVRDNSPRSNLWLDEMQQHVTVVKGSFCDEDQVLRLIGGNSIDTIFHLGAQTVVGVGKADPTTTLDVNVRGTWNLLEAARQKGVKQTLIASTAFAAAADGSQGEDPSAELATILQQPYAVSKICMELIARVYAHSYGMRVGMLRFGNIYGGGDLHFSRLIPGAIRSALRGERFSFRTPGASMRDFLYVEDAVTAYLRFAEQLAVNPALSERRIAFGLGQRLSLIDLVRLIYKHAGRDDIPPIVGSSPTPEISEKALDLSEAKQSLGWEPRYSLDEGMSRTIQWFQSYFGQKPVEQLPVGNPEQ